MVVSYATAIIRQLQHVKPLTTVDVAGTATILLMSVNALRCAVPCRRKVQLPNNELYGLTLLLYTEGNV